MEQVGIVKEVKGNEIVLEVRRTSACGSNCGSCSSACEVAPHYITMDNSVGAKIGDIVEIKAEAKSILKYTFAIYIVPLIFLIIGVAVGYAAFNGKYSNYEFLSFLTGLFALGLSLLVLKSIDKRAAKKKDVMLTISRIISR